MKTSIKNLLRGGVFALAATFAFAFTENNQPQQEYAVIDEENQVYENITGLQIGVHYLCETGNACTVTEPGGPVLKSGRFEWMDDRSK